MKDARFLNATLASFVLFLAGIVAYGFAFPGLRSLIADDRLFAALTLGYFVLLRFGGRWVARRLMAQR